MIEVTDEMCAAFEGAAWPKSWCGGDPLWEDGLAAVLAIVERDYLRVDGVHRDGRVCRPGNRCVYCSPDPPP